MLLKPYGSLRNTGDNAETQAQRPRQSDLLEEPGGLFLKKAMDGYGAVWVLNHSSERWDVSHGKADRWKEIFWFKKKNLNPQWRKCLLISERGEGREKERERNIDTSVHCFSFAPWPRSKPAAFQFTGWHKPTEPHQPRWDESFSYLTVIVQRKKSVLVLVIFWKLSD